MKKISQLGFSLLNAAAFLLMFILLLVNYSDGWKYESDNFLRRSDDWAVRKYQDRINDTVLQEAAREKLIAELKMWYRSKLSASGNSTYLLNVGVLDVRENDRYDAADPFSETGVKQKYFLSVSGFRLKKGYWFGIDSSVYFLDSVQRKRIGVRYSTETGSEPGLLFPVSKTGYNWLNILFLIAAVPGLMLVVGVCFVFPYVILLNISHGDAFVSQNYRFLRLMGYSLLAAALIPLLNAVITSLFLDKEVSDAFYYPYPEKLIEEKFKIIGGNICLLLARAFRKGYALQQEQDLTV